MRPSAVLTTRTTLSIFQNQILWRLTKIVLQLREFTGLKILLADLIKVKALMGVRQAVLITSQAQVKVIHALFSGSCPCKLCHLVLQL